MSRDQISSSDLIRKEQNKIEEPANLQLAVEELRALVKGMWIKLNTDK